VGRTGDEIEGNIVKDPTSNPSYEMAICFNSGHLEQISERILMDDSRGIHLGLKPFNRQPSLLCSANALTI
jgi:hypothetical protein